MNLKGVMVQDLERNRSMLTDELKGGLAMVQKAIQETDMASLAERFLNELTAAREKEEAAKQDCQQLRDHCEELLRLNVHLRQAELPNQIDRLMQHASKLENEAERIE